MPLTTCSGFDLGDFAEVDPDISPRESGDLGIPLAWGGIPRLVREIGPAATKELVLTCRPFDADEAKQLRFVNMVVPRADLDSREGLLTVPIRDK